MATLGRYTENFDGAMLAAAAALSVATATDATGRHVHVVPPSQRIVAPTPSAVETLFAIGAGSAIVRRGRQASSSHRRPTGYRQ